MGKDTMTHDDIYYAATSGNSARLMELLSEGGAELLNQTLTSQLEDGSDTQYTLVFSILAEMKDDMRYDILDMLVKFGASFTKPVILKTEGVTKERPLLEYAISVWKNPRMVEYLLKNGASPDAEHKETDGRGKISRTTMLWYALNAGKDMQMLELLLSYGADPEKCCEVYNYELGVYQYLPPLYYSLVDCSSYDKTVCLLRYGASPQCGIDVGIGFKHNTNFMQYLQFNYPGLRKSLVSAFENAQSAPAPRRLVTLKARQAEEVPSVEEIKERANSGTLGHRLNAGSRVNSLSRCYGKGAAYGFGNFGIIGLAFGIIGPLIALNSEQPEAALGMLLFGLPSLLIAAGIWLSVQKKAKERGQDGVMPQFVADSVLMFAKVLLMMTIILIPLVKHIGSDIQWEEHTTASGGRVTVKKTGEGEYEDAAGNRYVEKDT